jgi:hypothetical protein
MNIFKKGIGSYLNNCFQSVFRIRNADPDPAFYLNATSNLDLGSADPCGSESWSDFAHKKLDFDMRKILYVSNKS